MTGPRSAPARQLDVDTRRADLRRMRTIATLLLVLMIVVFVATTVTTLDWPWLPYVRAFAEAGMVGACADWFAVVALFRHPLGIPIPHTAIIPSNRDRIGPALGRFITNNFLDVKVAHERLVQVDILGRLAHWLNDSIIRGQFVDNVSRILPKILRALPGPAAAELLGKIARYGIESIPAAPAASKILAVLWAGGAAEQALDRAIVFAELSLARNKDVIGQKGRRAHLSMGARVGRSHHRRAGDEWIAEHPAGVSQSRASMAGRTGASGRETDRRSGDRPADVGRRRSHQGRPACESTVRRTGQAAMGRD